MASCQPVSCKGFVNQSSLRFTSELDDEVPGIGYTQQELPDTVKSGPPPEKIASAIHVFRYLLERCDQDFLRKHLLSTSKKRQLAQFNLSYHFRSKEDVESFLKGYPQYFSFTNEAVYNPHEFTEYGLIQLLEKNRRQQENMTPVPYKLIESLSDCKDHVDKLRSRALKKPPLVLAMDCEGVNLGKDGPLTLLQLGTADGEVFIFDVLATPKREDMFQDGGLKGLLEDENILKLIHDCRNDQCALYFQFGVNLTNVFDTSVRLTEGSLHSTYPGRFINESNFHGDVTTAYTTLWDQCNVAGEPRRPKLTALLHIFAFEARHKTDGSFISQISHYKLFEKHPLTKQMLEYASDDVLCLVSGIYETMDRLISPLWRPYFENEVKKDLRESRIRDPQETYLMRKKQRLC